MSFGNLFAGGLSTNAFVSLISPRRIFTSPCLFARLRPLSVTSELLRHSLRFCCELQLNCACLYCTRRHSNAAAWIRSGTADCIDRPLDCRSSTLHFAPPPHSTAALAHVLLLFRLSSSSRAERGRRRSFSSHHPPGGGVARDRRARTAEAAANPHHRTTARSGREREWKWKREWKRSADGEQ